MTLFHAGRVAVAVAVAVAIAVAVPTSAAAGDPWSTEPVRGATREDPRVLGDPATCAPLN